MKEALKLNAYFCSGLVLNIESFLSGHCGSTPNYLFGVAKLSSLAMVSCPCHASTGRQRQEDQDVRVVLDYAKSLRPVWAT